MAKVLSAVTFLTGGKHHCTCGKVFEKDEDGGREGRDFYCIPCIEKMGATIFQYPQVPWTSHIGFIPAS